MMQQQDKRPSGVWDFVGKRYGYFLFSLLIIVPGLISLCIPPALKLGIEFSSGTTMTLRFDQPVNEAAVRDTLTQLGQGEAIIQKSGENVVLLRLRTLQPERRDSDGNVVTPSERDTLQQALRERVGAFTVVDFATVSPIVATEIGNRAFMAVVVASIAILLYITWAFRRLPKPFRYGTCAIIAMIHDVLVVVGIFSILGKLFDVHIDSMFITGLLTVIGYSVHDTIVVFDRIRENMGKGFGISFEEIVNRSIMETMGRSINTVLTVLITLLALLLFGGVTIRIFLLTLLVGLISGTYSSIFNASQLLVVWERGELGSFIRRVQTGQLRPSTRVGGAHQG